jgi:hypothetical protein
MTTLEDRLREALAERAAHSPIAPDAWHKTLARGRRRPRLGWALRWTSGHAGLVIPAAAAAAVVAIIVAATTLTGGAVPRANPGAAVSHAPAGGGTSPSPDPTGTPAAPPGPGNLMFKLAPPATPMIEFKMVFPGQTDWYFLWLGHYTRSATGELMLCDVTYVGNHPGGGWCSAAPRLGTHQVVRQAGGMGSVLIGIGAAEVASVTAWLPSGDVPGQVKSGRGFPYKIWLADIAMRGRTVVVFRDAAGREVARLTNTGLPPLPPRPSSGGITVFSLPGDTMTAYLKDGKIGFWGSDGNVTGWMAIEPSRLRMLENWHNRIEWFGYAAADVARVALREASGRLFSVLTIPGWPGSRITLWGPVVVPVDVALRDITIITYDTAGHVLAKVPFQSAISG